jgi:hypothetical protein
VQSRGQNGRSRGQNGPAVEWSKGPDRLRRVRVAEITRGTGSRGRADSDAEHRTRRRRALSGQSGSQTSESTVTDKEQLERRATVTGGLGGGAATEYRATKSAAKSGGGGHGRRPVIRTLEQDECRREGPKSLPDDAPAGPGNSEIGHESFHYVGTERHVPQSRSHVAGHFQLRCKALERDRET